MRATKRQSAWSKGVVLSAALALLAGPACSDEEEPKPTPPVSSPDAGGQDVGGQDVGPDGADAGDDASTEDADAAEGEDVGEDAAEDVAPDVEGVDAGDDAAPDVEGEDVGEDVEEGEDAEVDAEVPPELLTDFTQSCLFPVVSCLTPTREALSCTINAVDGRVAVSFGEGLAQLSEERLVEGRALTIYADGAPCFEALPIDDPDAPRAWEIRDLQGGGAYTVAVLGEQTRINCASGLGEDFVPGRVEPYLPTIYGVADGLCEEVATAECASDAACGAGVCCAAAGVTRCLEEAACPEVEAAPSAGLGCLAPVLGCFGADATPTSCLLQGVDSGETVMGYAGDRSARFVFGEGGDATIEASAGGSACWTATATASFGFLDRYVFSAAAGGTYTVELGPDGAAVTCADGTSDVVDVSLVERFLPPLLGEGDPLCDVECASDASCGGSGRCCQVEEGYRCLNTQLCPPPPNPLAGSCIGETFGCFGESPEQVSCVDYDYVDLTQVTYRSGASASFFTAGETPSVRTRYPIRDCFEAAWVDGGYEVQDLESGAVFHIGVSGGSATLSCPDTSTEVLDAGLVERFLPPRPDGATCDAPSRNDACQVDADCTNALLPVCCDTGTRNRCNSAAGCEAASPRQSCGASDACATPGEVCCERPSAKVCDYAICGDAICCDALEARVCGAEACEAEYVCDPDDADACGGGSVCCQGPVGGDFTCRAPLACADGEALACTGSADCGAGEECCASSGACVAAGSCEGAVRCQEDSECGGGVCCDAFAAPICVEDAAACPSPCRSEDDCGAGLVCCSSEASVWGPHCSAPEACQDVLSRGCDSNAACGAGELCCRTLDEPTCVDAAACPEVCTSDASCGAGMECCGNGRRTPVCVPSGTCAKELGESCGEASECADGLTCCPYDGRGDVCIPQAFCGQGIPEYSCGGDPSYCNKLPLAVCCTVGGEATCARPERCDLPPGQLCLSDESCGPSGLTCCGSAVDPTCQTPDEGICEVSNFCFEDLECEAGLVCCPFGDSGRCLPADLCAGPDPRRPCEEAGDCFEGACCSLGTVRVCDLTLCNGAHCCEIDTPVCAAPGECP